MVVELEKPHRKTMRIRVVFAVVGSSLIQKFLRPELKREIIFHPLAGVSERCDGNPIRRKRRHSRSCPRTALTTAAVLGCRYGDARSIFREYAAPCGGVCLASLSVSLAASLPSPLSVATTPAATAT
jgi:hypothetical protein